MQRDDEIAFVEAKAILATGRGSLARIVNEAAVELMHYLSMAPYLRRAVYRGFIVGTEILEVDRFQYRILEIAQ